MRKSMRVAVMAAAAVACVLCACGKDATAINAEDYIELGQYKELDYTKVKYEPSDEEIQDELNYLASAYADSIEITDGVVEDGDTVNIDYQGKKDGVPFEGGTYQGYDLVIGSGSFIEGFESGLIGAGINETLDLNLTFPEEYGEPSLAGQDVVFTVKVNSITRPQLPEMTDEFISEISEGQYSDVDSYLVALKQEMIDSFNQEAELTMYTDLLTKAVENATIKQDIPKDYIQNRIEIMMANTRTFADQMSMSTDDFIEQYMGMSREEYNTQMIDYANTAAKESLVVMAIANAEGLVITDEEFDDAVAEYVEMYEYENAEEFAKDQDMDQFREYLQTSKVQEYLVDNAVITME